MPVGTPRTQAGISIAIARDPSLVRTVRLVAAAVARRASPSEDLVEEVRLAVGEACAVMVSGLSGVVTEAPDDKVKLQMDIGERLYVSLSCASDGAVSYSTDAIDPWALLRGLTDDLVVTNRDGQTAVAMSWAV
ncbi:MAG TPA: ATP-binding protein [Nocardioidaceae bacterium]|nr:ATP-binding protein [Nocardioidaceae bacterium]